MVLARELYLSRNISRKYGPTMRMILTINLSRKSKTMAKHGRYNVPLFTRTAKSFNVIADERMTPIPVCTNEEIWRATE